MTPVIRRRTPEELLLQAQAEEARETRGRLKIFLGYASGVGKSFRMLDEGRRRAERGQDVVIQLPASPDVETLLKRLEVIPLRSLGGVEVMDMPTILKRHPRVCLVDGLAWDNPPGSMNPSRWQDVRQLLDSDIAVIASINIQYRRRCAASPTRSWSSRSRRKCAWTIPDTASPAIRGSWRGSFRSFAKLRCCSPPTWWTISSNPT